MVSTMQKGHMTALMALNAMQYDGALVRMPDWPAGEYIYMASDGVVYSSTGQDSLFCVATSSDTWEVYKIEWLKTGDRVIFNADGVEHVIVWADEHHAVAKVGDREAFLIDRASFSRYWRMVVAPPVEQEITVSY